MRLKASIFIIIGFIFFMVLPVNADSGNNASHTLIDIIVNNDVSQGWVDFTFDESGGKSAVNKIEQNFPDRVVIMLPDTKLGGELREGVFYENLFCASSRGIKSLTVNETEVPPTVRLTLYLGQDLKSYLESNSNLVASLKLTDQEITGTYSEKLIASKDGLKTPADELDEIIKKRVYGDLESAGPDIDKQIEAVNELIKLQDNVKEAAGPSDQGAKYRIQAGDKLEIIIIGEPDFSAAVKVRPDGYITYQLLGDVVAEGLTPSELAMILKSRLMAEYFKYDIALTVSVVDYTPSSVYLIGNVPQAGPIVYRKGMTVLDVINYFDKDKVNIKNVSVIRKGQGTINVNLDDILKGDIKQNIELMPQDYIVLPSTDFINVMVFGKIRQPGMYRVPIDARIYDAIGVAGGLADRCDIQHVFILRNNEGTTERIEVNLRTFNEQLDDTQNIQLKERDILFVPEVNRPNWDQVLRSLQTGALIFYDFKRSVDLTP